MSQSVNEPTQLWLTREQFAERFQMSYRNAGRLCGKLPGHWVGNRYKFNASKCEDMYRSGKLDEAINGLA